MTTDLASPPSPAFWLDDLGFARLPELMPLLDAPAALADALDVEVHGSSTRDLVGGLVEDSPEPTAARLHLLLVAAFLEKKKSSAVRDVARAFLPPEVLDRHGGAGDDHLARLPLAVELYVRDPRHLLAIEVCHRWHSKRRCAMEAFGPRRALPSPLPALPWPDLGPTAVADLPASLRSRYHPAWGLVVPRLDGSEVLVAFRERADPAAVRVRDGHVSAGHNDAWTVLRFHREARCVDLTGRSQILALALAEALARRIWSVPVSYVPAAGQLSSRSLQEFLGRLRDPDDDTFRLLEITAELPSHEDRPLLTLGNSGQARIEPALQALRRTQALAERWDTVHQVKVGFGQRHRIVVHFPAPGDPLALTYSDKERDKDVSQAFERLFREELGIGIHPKATRTRERHRREVAEPPRYGAATWARLLGPVLDDPAAWERAAIAREAAGGLLVATDHAVLRCGDASADREAVEGDTLDCPGEVELPYGQADPRDPFRQEDDCEVVCGACGRAWRPGRYRVPLVHRVRVRVNHGAAWARILGAASRLGRFDEEAPGVASGLVGGRRSYVLYLPVVPPEWREAAVLGAHPTCRIGLPGDPALAAYGDLALDLAALLADEEALGRALALARARLPAAVPYAPLVLPAPPSVADARTVRPTPDEGQALPDRAWITRDASGVWLGTTPLAHGRVKALAQILALLGAAAAQDDAAGRERRFRNVQQLTELARGVKVGNVQTWVSRARDLIAKATGDSTLGDQVIEAKWGKGYRLGARFVVVGMGVEEVFGGG